MAKVSMRLVPDQHPEKIGELFEEYLRRSAPKTVELKFTRMHGGKPWMTEFDNKYVRAAGPGHRAGFRPGAGVQPRRRIDPGRVDVPGGARRAERAVRRRPADENAHAPDETARSRELPQRHHRVRRTSIKSSHNCRIELRADATMSLGVELFASIYDRFTAGAEAAGLRALRQQLLANARRRVLEIGAGTGANVPFYGADVELTLAEPEEPMAKRLAQRLREQRSRAELVEAPAERLPFEDARFDVVVSTLVLCTVADPNRALKESRRVLKPGGRLLFLEHVRSDDPDVARWQDRLNGINRFIAYGCNCNRSTLDSIRAAGFAVASLERTQFQKLLPSCVRSSSESRRHRERSTRRPDQLVLVASLAGFAATLVLAQGTAAPGIGRRSRSAVRPTHRARSSPATWERRRTRPPRSHRTRSSATSTTSAHGRSARF